MPARGPICALRASARRTSGSGCSGWPTPKAKEDGRTLEDYEKGRQKGYKTRKGKTSGGPASKQGGLAIAAQLAGWPTPQHRDGDGRGGQAGRADGTRMNLDDYALLAGWPTPMAGSPGTEDYNPAGNTDSSRKTVALLAGWATPNVRDHKDTGPNVNFSRVASRIKIAGQANLAMARPAWVACPCCEDYLCTIHGMHAHECPCPEVSEWEADPYSTPGPPSTSSPAGTARCGALNPEHSRWLMGFPAAWGCCAATATRSCRR
jgi:hypothetical protein